MTLGIDSAPEDGTHILGQIELDGHREWREVWFDREVGLDGRPCWVAGRGHERFAYESVIAWAQLVPLAADRVLLPDAMTPAIAQVLGMPNFQCGPIAHLFRNDGADIKRRSEDEQAYVLWRFLRLAIVHGADWRKVASEEMMAAIDRLRGRRGAEPSA